MNKTIRNVLITQKYKEFLSTLELFNLTVDFYEFSATILDVSRDVVATISYDHIEFNDQELE